MPAGAPLGSAGAEVYASAGVLPSAKSIDGATGGTAPPTRDTTVKNTLGLASFKCDPATGSSTSFVSVPQATGGITTFGYKGSFRIDGAPTGQKKIIQSDNPTALALDASGHLVAVSDAGTVLATSTQTFPFGDGLFHTIEHYIQLGVNPQNRQIARLDGRVVLDTGNYTGVSSTGPTLGKFGWIDAPGAASVLWVDDLFIYQPVNPIFLGDIRVVFAVPVSDVSQVGWLNAAGGTTNLFACVDNAPPTGAASPSGTSQIQDANKSTTDQYVANVTTLGDLGITVNDFLFTTRPFAMCGNGTTTAITEVFASADGLVSNFSVIPGAVAAGAWPTNWTAGTGSGYLGYGDGAGGTITRPTVAQLAQQRTLNITKGTSTNRAGYCAIMGLEIVLIREYPTDDEMRPSVFSQAVKRSSFYFRALRPSWERRRLGDLWVPPGLLLPEFDG